MNERSLLGYPGGVNVETVLCTCYTSTMSTEKTEKKETTINTRYPADVYEAVKQLAHEDSRSFNNMVMFETVYPGA